MAFWQWSKTASNNGNADPTINYVEGQAGSTLNDSCRNLMAVLAGWRDDTSGVLITTNSGATYQLGSNENFTTIPPNGQHLVFMPNVTNPANALLQVDGGTSFPIQSSPGVAAPAGAMVAGAPYSVTFNQSIPAWLLNDFYLLPIGPASITGSMIAANTVAYGNIQQVTNGHFLGNFSGATANVSEYAVGGLLAVSGGTLGIATDTGNKGKPIGYDPSTGAPTALIAGGSLLHVREQQAAGTGGQSPVGAGYNQRVLNTVLTNEITGASLTSNQVTLPAGTYFCSGSAVVGFSSSSNSTCATRIKLFNVTAAANLILGQQAYMFGNISAGGNVPMPIFGRFTLGVNSVVELRYFNNAVNGGFANSGSGDPEVWTDLMFWKVG